MAFGLGIESSCDETSIAVVEDGKKLVSLKIYSQIENHAPYRGVVPELASRAHLEKINPLLEMAINESGIDLKNLSYVAVTAYPGLIGSLMIGATLARCLSLVYELPIIPVNHLEAHLSVLALEENFPSFPSLGVLLSGGNSSIYIYHGFGQMELIGDTMDDALGEAFDKVSSLLNLPYPGGPFIEKAASTFLPPPNHISFFPKLLKESSSEEIAFSFSGLKTSVLYHVKENRENLNLPQICFDFQNSAFELVLRNVKKAVAKTGIRNVIFAGGVMANGTLRDRIHLESKKENWTAYYPQKKIYCTDNGAMVACLGYYLWKAGENAPIDFRVSPKRKLNI